MRVRAVLAIAVMTSAATATSMPVRASSPISYASASLVAGSFSEAGPVAQCPAGSAVSGGGVKVGDGLSSISVEEMYDNTAATWQSFVFNNGAATHKVTTKAACIATSAGTIVSHAFGPTAVGSGASSTAFVTCAGGENLLGGGLSVASGGGGINVAASRPTDTHDGWVYKAFNGGAPNSITVYALCSTTLGPAVFKEKAINVVTGNTGTVAAKCPNGTKAVSGGGAVETANQLGGSFPMKHGSGWKAMTRVGSGNTRSLTAYAICLDPTP